MNNIGEILDQDNLNCQNPHYHLFQYGNTFNIDAVRSIQNLRKIRISSTITCVNQDAYCNEDSVSFPSFTCIL